MNNIEEFIKNRPSVIAAFGYGSGIFKQSGYTDKDKPQIDLLFIVDDIKKWHKENIKLNKKDYSFIGRNFFKNGKIKNLKKATNIVYVANIVENGNVYKYGTIELNDLINDLSTWNIFYMAGRFQKTIYPIVEANELNNIIVKNRDNALLLASYLVNSDTVTKKDLLVILCGLSYLGDTRMKFAENPRKVLNIVEGSYDKFLELYDFNKPYLTLKDDYLIIDKSLVKKELVNLPSGLVEYIKPYLDKEDNLIKEKIYEYFTKLNKKESSAQTIKGLKTNGIIRSISYASKKISKRFKKQK